MRFLNLRDSGVRSAVGLFPRAAPPAPKAVNKEGLPGHHARRSRGGPDVIIDSAPTQSSPNSIATPSRQISSGKTLMFAHGFNIARVPSNRPANVERIHDRSQSSRPTAFAKSSLKSGGTRRAPPPSNKMPRARAKALRACLRERARLQACRRPGNHFHRGDRETDLFSGEASVLGA